LRFQALEICVLIPDVANEKFPGRIQAHALRQSLEDRRAQLFFKILNFAGECGGRDVQMLGRSPDGSPFRNVGDQLKCTQMFHFFSLGRPLQIKQRTDQNQALV
jgi:hypothetical protein